MIEQRSEEWYQVRLGKVTASRVADVVRTQASGKPAASRANYEAELIAERLSGVPAESFASGPMQWGIETEPQAIAAYEFAKNLDVEKVGFVDHPNIQMAGASPDGLVGEDGLVEIKCPNTATHLATLLKPTPAKDYVTQMQWQMACTGRKWCDFMSFDPRLPERMQYVIHRVRRDEQRIRELESAVETFLEELERKIDELERLVA